MIEPHNPPRNAALDARAYQARQRLCVAADRLDFLLDDAFRATDQNQLLALVQGLGGATLNDIKEALSLLDDGEGAP